jgi:hypothetical protein
VAGGQDDRGLSFASTRADSRELSPADCEGLPLTTHRVLRVRERWPSGRDRAARVLLIQELLVCSNAMKFLPWGGSGHERPGLPRRHRSCFRDHLVRAAGVEYARTNFATTRRDLHTPTETEGPQYVAVGVRSHRVCGRNTREHKCSLQRTLARVGARALPLDGRRPRCARRVVGRTRSRWPLMTPRRMGTSASPSACTTPTAAPLNSGHSSPSASPSTMSLTWPTRPRGGAHSERGESLRRLDNAGRDSVDPDAAGGVLDGQRLGG